MILSNSSNEFVSIVNLELKGSYDSKDSPGVEALSFSYESLISIGGERYAYGQRSKYSGRQVFWSDMIALYNRFALLWFHNKYVPCRSPRALLLDQELNLMSLSEREGGIFFDFLLWPVDPLNQQTEIPFVDGEAYSIAFTLDIPYGIVGDTNLSIIVTSLKKDLYDMVYQIKSAGLWSNSFQQDFDTTGLSL